MLCSDPECLRCQALPPTSCLRQIVAEGKASRGKRRVRLKWMLPRPLAPNASWARTDDRRCKPQHLDFLSSSPPHGSQATPAQRLPRHLAVLQQTKDSLRLVHSFRCCVVHERKYLSPSTPQSPRLPASAGTCKARCLRVCLVWCSTTARGDSTRGTQQWVYPPQSSPHPFLLPQASRTFTKSTIYRFINYFYRLTEGTSTVIVFACRGSATCQHFEETPTI